MSETPVHVLNERVKAVATILFNLATALFAASAARMWSYGGLDITSGLWIAGAFVLTWIAWRLLVLLELEV